ncbi:hypothetical protein [Nonomuraea mesophila]|nr:hypothetical protein [Nonomuraea mesophila]
MAALVALTGSTTAQRSPGHQRRLHERQCGKEFRTVYHPKEVEIAAGFDG